jgi:hypothetical protein
MRTIRESSRFRRDLSHMRRRGKDLSKLYDVVETLAGDGQLAPQHRPLSTFNCPGATGSFDSAIAVNDLPPSIPLDRLQSMVCVSLWLQWYLPAIGTDDHRRIVSA